MLQRRPRGLAMVLENQDVLEPSVLLQIEDAVAKGPQNVFDSLRRKRGKTRSMVGRLNNDLVRADPVHAIEHALRLAIQRTFNSKGWELVGHDPDRPSRRIPLRRRPAIRVR